MKISICVVTYRRPEGLRRLLDGLNALELPEPAPEIEVIVVDNDSARGAEAVCSSARDGFRWELNYDVEARRGIAPARNKASALVSSDADWIASIDDDEVPEPSWLMELLRVQRETDADVVAGPSLPFFAEPVSPWIEAGGFFEPQRHPDGSAIAYAFTGNVLFRASILADARFSPPFAERFALSGGEDRHFFQRVGRAGYRLRWSDGALVHEWVHASRANAKWLVHRMFRVGNALAFIESELEPGWRRRSRLLARACAEVLTGLVTLPRARFQGTAASVRARQRIASSLGMLWGLLGGTSEGYREVHGS
jgi:glycosyltransferase involved in cell wall biosynthesis